MIVWNTLSILVIVLFENRIRPTEMSPFKVIVEVDKGVWSTWSIMVMVLFEDRIGSSEMSIFKIVEPRKSFTLI